jgi:hypothetical protein
MEFLHIYLELANGTGVIQKLVEGVTQAEATIRPNSDAWSILEVVCHLLDEEREDFRAHLDLILNRPEEGWQQINPGEWLSERKYNQRNLAEMLEQFLAERKISLAWLQGLQSPQWDASYQVPFGRMQAGDMLAAWAAHDNLHIRQLVELRRARVVSMADPYDVRYAGDW